MPRFSVIVPAHKVQAHLHACLDSVLGQSFTDVEVIAVDDRSPDACGEIIDEYAARDGRITALHLSRNEGPGGARNAGLDRAIGDYLLFLDGDDTLTPGALQAIADRLKETAEPDILLYDHARARWDGSTTPDGRAGLFARTAPQVFSATDRPDLLHLPSQAWTWACRREFAERRGLMFPAGRHESLPWTYPALLAADSIGDVLRSHRRAAGPGHPQRGRVDRRLRHRRLAGPPRDPAP